MNTRTSCSWKRAVRLPLHLARSSAYMGGRDRKLHSRTPEPRRGGISYYVQITKHAPSKRRFSFYCSSSTGVSKWKFLSRAFPHIDSDHRQRRGLEGRSYCIYLIPSPLPKINSSNGDTSALPSTTPFIIHTHVTRTSHRRCRRILPCAHFQGNSTAHPDQTRHPATTPSPSACPADLAS